MKTIYTSIMIEQLKLYHYNQTENKRYNSNVENGMKPETAKIIYGTNHSVAINRYNKNCDSIIEQRKKVIQ